MRNLKAMLLVAVGSVVVAGSAIAQTVYDDFNAKWVPLVLGSGTSLSRDGNQAQASLSAGASGSSGSAITIGRGLSSKCSITGDFDLQVSFKLVKWPAGNGVRASLHVGDSAGIANNQGIWLERISLSAPDGGPQEVYVFFANEVLDVVSTSHKTGALRLTRVGTTVTGFFKQGTTWIAVGSITSTTSPLRFSFLANSNDALFNNVAVQVAFDDVILAAGTLTGTRCPFLAP